MAPRSMAGRLVSPVGFGLALLLFLLPFVTVSGTLSATDPEFLPGLSVDGPFTVRATVSGVDLLTGDRPDVGLRFPDPEGPAARVALTDEANDRLDERFGGYLGVQPLVAIALAVIVAALVATALRRTAAVTAAVTVAGALAAIVLLGVQVFVVSPRLVAAALAEQRDSELLAGLRAAPHTAPAIGFWAATLVLTGLAWFAARARLRPNA